MNNIRHFEEENQKCDLHSQSPDFLSETTSHADLMSISNSKAKHFGFSDKNIYISKTIINSLLTNKKQQSRSVKKMEKTKKEIAFSQEVRDLVDFIEGKSSNYKEASLCQQ